VIREVPTIFEIGANDGTDTLALAAAFPEAEIYCFEPEPRAIRSWRQKVTSARAELIEVAIGSHDGTATFHRSDFAENSGSASFDEGWDKSGSIRRPTKHLERWPWVSFPTSIEVPIRSLDSWTQERGIGEVDLIWADIQGAEIDLVLGATSTLRRTRYLYTEIFDEAYYEGQITLAELLRELPGWSLVYRWPDDAMLRNDAFGS